MITDVPTSQDFYASGRELLDFAWDTIAGLLVDFDDYNDCGCDSVEISDAYWKSAKRELNAALSIAQQGVDFILKGKIADISPYLLIADRPSNWPSPYTDATSKFSRFRTIDAQDLVRVHDTFCNTRLPPVFSERLNSLRGKRNTIMHSIDKSLSISVIEVVDTILFMHKRLFPDETWGQVRSEFLSISPDTEFGGIDLVTNRACREVELAVKLLGPEKVTDYFGIDKKQRRYLCPKCYFEANRDPGFDIKLAVLSPEGEDSDKSILSHLQHKIRCHERKL